MADALGYANEFAFRPFLLKADSIDAAEAIVTEALQGGKFGIIWRASPQDILKARIDKDIGPYVILGVCNPPLAHRLLMHEPNAGAHLPCNVFIRASGDDFIVGGIDPAKSLVTSTTCPEVAEIANEASALLAGILDALRERETAGASSAEAASASAVEEGVTVVAKDA